MSLKAIASENPPYSKFLLTVGLVLLSAVFFTLLSTLIAMSISGLNVEQFQQVLNNYSDPQAIAILKFVQAFSSAGSFIIPGFLIAFLLSAQPMKYLAVNRPAHVYTALLVVLLVIAALPFINWMGELNSRMTLPSFFSSVEQWMEEAEDKAAELTKGFLDMHSAADLFLDVFILGLLPAIGEELIFRGILQKIFAEWTRSIHAGIWISAILFSAMHVQFYGFLPRMMLGVMLGYLMYWSGSLWLPVLAHFINNSAAVVFTYLFREQVMAVDADKIGTEGETVSVIVSVMAVTGLLWLIYKNEKNRRAQISEVVF